ncbi:MAG TPA: hypothetical protein PLX23_00430 [Candidatus Hydrogenedens sp.]|nr:hypothetical protein [Candidatus Hydrogenedens sp.]
MTENEKEILVSKIILHAVLPVIKVLLEDHPTFRKRFENIKGTVQFIAKNGDENIGAYVKFDNLNFETAPEILEKPDITFKFSSLKKMNDFFTGKLVLPKIKGWKNFSLLWRIFSVLLALKLLMPDAKPKNTLEKKLKVKLTLYMVSTALSQLNKAGDPDMVKWTSQQPERIYQWSVDNEDIACWLKVKAGQTKSGRGMYTLRKPFIHMRFPNIDSALPVLTNSVETVQAMAQGLVIIEGSPEYAGKLGDFMLKIADLLT